MERYHIEPALTTENQSWVIWFGERVPLGARELQVPWKRIPKTSISQQSPEVWDDIRFWWPWAPEIPSSEKERAASAEKEYANRCSLWLLADRLQVGEVVDFVDEYILTVAREADVSTDLDFKKFSACWGIKDGGDNFPPRLKLTLLRALAHSKDFDESFGDAQRAENALRMNLPKTACLDIVGYLLVLGKQCVRAANQEVFVLQLPLDLLRAESGEFDYQHLMHRAEEAVKRLESGLENSRHLGKDLFLKSADSAVQSFWERFKEDWTDLTELRKALGLSINALHVSLLRKAV